jgi:MFS superfamily sulfate permease-like transporter
MRNELQAGITVAFVALPVSLGISIAAGLPPSAGIISSLVGGIIIGLWSGTNVTVMGPPKSIILITLGAVTFFSQGDPMLGIQAVCTAFFFSGIIIFLLGLSRIGDFGDFFPSSAVSGLMSAIGIMILISQIPTLFGLAFQPKSLGDFFLGLAGQTDLFNPSVAIIGISSLVFLFLYPSLNGKLIKLIPAPMWVILYSMLMGFLLNFGTERDLDFLGWNYSVGPQLMLQLSPENFKFDFFPNFGQLEDFHFWTLVINLTLVCTLESLVSARAIDKIDPLQRVSNLNRYLAATGIGTVISSLIGGMPVIAAIMSSSVGINNGGKTKFVNLVHALVIALMVLFGAILLNRIPYASLAAILVFTGYKLASPQKFKKVLMVGNEQFFIFLSTILVTLFTDLIFGLAAGVITTFFIHLFSIQEGKNAFSMIFKSTNHLHYDDDDKHYYLSIRRYANFFNYLGLKSKINSIPKDQFLIMDFSQAKFIDHTVMEHLQNLSEGFQSMGGKLEIIGLNVQTPFSNHPLAARKLVIGSTPRQPRKKFNITPRQRKLKRMTYSKGWELDVNINWKVEKLRSFHFFQNKQLLFQTNIIKGNLNTLPFIISDVSYTEGILEGGIDHRTTFLRYPLREPIPVFVLERELVIDRVIHTADSKDIVFRNFRHFSNHFHLYGPDEKGIREFFSKEMILFFETHSVYHIESSGNSILVFPKEKLVKATQIEIMVAFVQELLEKISK